MRQIFPEEVEAGTASSPNTTVVVETETKTTSCEVSVDRQFSEASTNTEPNARDPGSRGWCNLFRNNTNFDFSNLFFMITGKSFLSAYVTNPQDSSFRTV